MQLGLSSGDASKGEKGLGIFPERRAEFRASVTEALDYAEAVGASMVHAMAGILPPAQRAQHHWDCYVENLAFAAAEARPRGIKVIVEPMSQGAVPDYFIATPDRAARAIAEAGEDEPRPPAGRLPHGEYRFERGAGDRQARGAAGPRAHRGSSRPA